VIFGVLPYFVVDELLLLFTTLIELLGLLMFYLLFLRFWLFVSTL
jgi:hypothetical protein